MQAPHLLGAAALLAGVGLLLLNESATDAAAVATPPDTTTGTTATATPTPADGHYVLVVEGDRNALTITHASHKQDRWGGTPKGLTSNWTLSVLDATGTELTRLPLDMSPFDLRAERVGAGVSVQGCIVHDTRVGMLVSVPCFATASTYVLEHDAAVVGTIAAATVNQLARGGR